jgi:predicted glycosyltransferase
MNVLIVVTHLLGTGHLARALTLGRAFASAGHQVTLASGGMPVPLLDHAGLTFLQLPPIRSDGVNFTRLLDGDHQEVAEATFTARQTALIGALTPAPDILITELFPFGRRVLSAEFLGLLEAAIGLPSPPVILASIRDILAPPSKPSKAIRADDIIARFYDAVLVHSDPAATRLEQSWPVSDMLQARLKYTGYVAPPAATKHPEQLGKDEILISAGGGAVGTALFETAIKAAHLMPTRRWRLLVGGHDGAARIRALERLNPPKGTIIEPARPEFRQMLRHVAASVNMCGYNTALDLMQAGTPAVLVPFDDGAEVEQTLRARSLAQMPAIEVMRSAEMTPRGLCDAVERVMMDGRRADTGLGFDGADQSVTLAVEMARARR